MGLSFAQVIESLSLARTAETADYAVLGVEPVSRVAHLAVSKAGAPALLVPVEHVPGHAARLTHGVVLYGAPSLEFSHGAKRWQEPAAVIECREPKLLRTFAGLVVALVARLEATNTPSWEVVASLFSEWEELLGRRQLLTGESYLLSGQDGGRTMWVHSLG